MVFVPKNIAVIGASGAIGGALTDYFIKYHPNAVLHAFSRSGAHIYIDYCRESSIAEAAALATRSIPLDLVIVASGLLHDGVFQPEKSLQDISADYFHRLFEANTIAPALVAKYFLPRLRQDVASRFAVLSARVGSISDNRLGGWYAYRASKAALNMFIKTAAIETKRRNPLSVVVGLHLGTVNSNLSAPFQRNIAAKKLFTPAYAAHQLIHVLERLQSSDSGKCFAWDGQEVLP